MSEPRTTLSDHLDVVNVHLVDVSARLNAGAISGEELHEFGDLLAALARAVHCYAEKLGNPGEAGGRNTVRQPPPRP